jgi:hypothetical protein
MPNVVSDSAARPTKHNASDVATTMPASTLASVPSPAAMRE